MNTFCFQHSQKQRARIFLRVATGQSVGEASNIVYTCTRWPQSSRGRSMHKLIEIKGFSNNPVQSNCKPLSKSFSPLQGPIWEMRKPAAWLTRLRWGQRQEKLLTFLAHQNGSSSKEDDFLLLLPSHLLHSYSSHTVHSVGIAACVYSTKYCNTVKNVQAD